MITIGEIKRKSPCPNSEPENRSPIGEIGRFLAQLHADYAFLGDLPRPEGEDAYRILATFAAYQEVGHPLLSWIEIGAEIAQLADEGNITGAYDILRRWFY